MTPPNNGWLPPPAERPRDYVPPQIRERGRTRRLALFGTLVLVVVGGGLVFAVSSCVSTWHEMSQPPPPPSAADQAAADAYAAKTLAETAVKAILKDPDSASFYGEDVRQPRVPIVCGAVNARNSFGGMTGATRFIVIGPEAELDEDPNQASFRRAWTRLCTDAQAAAASHKPRRHHTAPGP